MRRACSLIRNWKWTILTAALIITTLALATAGIGGGWHLGGRYSGPWWMYAAGFGGGAYIGNCGSDELRRHHARRGRAAGKR